MSASQELPYLPEEVLLPGRTRTGAGSSSRLLQEAAGFGPRGILVHGRSLRRAGVIGRMLERAPPGVQVACWEYGGGEPTLVDVERLLAFARACSPDWVAAVGGGSVLDTAKACAGLLRAPGTVELYHNGEPPPVSHIPFLAAPSTAGTGSECTGVCVLTNARTGVKKSFRHPSYVPRLVFLDHRLLATCPPSVIATAGLDALTQAIESYVSRGATWFTDQIALKAVSLVSRHLPAVHEAPEDPRAERLLLGSYLAGIALTNARLGIVHGLAHPLGAHFGISHGLACAACLPHAVAFNREAMGDKYARLSDAMGCDLLEGIRALLQRLDIRSPFAGRRMDRKTALIDETLRSGSTAANPRPVSQTDVENLLQQIFAP